ncbi:hypothetical protein BGZ52_010172, partial [Haplosporangium bisporale]
ILVHHFKGCRRRGWQEYRGTSSGSSRWSCPQEAPVRGFNLPGGTHGGQPSLCSPHVPSRLCPSFARHHDTLNPLHDDLSFRPGEPSLRLQSPSPISSPASSHGFPLGLEGAAEAAATQDPAAAPHVPADADLWRYCQAREQERCQPQRTSEAGAATVAATAIVETSASAPAATPTAGDGDEGAKHVFPIDDPTTTATATTATTATATTTTTTTTATTTTTTTNDQQHQHHGRPCDSQSPVCHADFGSAAAATASPAAGPSHAHDHDWSDHGGTKQVEPGHDGHRWLDGTHGDLDLRRHRGHEWIRPHPILGRLFSGRVQPRSPSHYHRWPVQRLPLD